MKLRDDIWEEIKGWLPEDLPEDEKKYSIDAIYNVVKPYLSKKTFSIRSYISGVMMSCAVCVVLSMLIYKYQNDLVIPITATFIVLGIIGLIIFVNDK